MSHQYEYFLYETAGQMSIMWLDGLVNIYLRIDTHFADIHGFMNVALVGAIP